MTPRGVVVIDKPLGMTSTDVVRRVRRRFSTRRVGHAGTLDPDASGVLIVCVGEATKAVPYLVSEHKTYVTTVQFGAETDTDDAAGEIRLEKAWEHLHDESVRAALPGFIGQHDQIPPRVSALKVAGRRMHERVRAGEDVDALLTPRPVECRDARLLRIDLPQVDVELHVGKGYYVRSFARDLGRTLDSAAHVRHLRRTRVGHFHVEQALHLDALDGECELTPLHSALSHLPSVTTDDRAAARLRHGQRIRSDDGLGVSHEIVPDQPVLVLEPTGNALAIGAFNEFHVLRILRAFAPEAS